MRYRPWHLKPSEVATPSSSLSDDDRLARQTLTLGFSACLATKPASTFVGHALDVGREINGLVAEARHDSRQRLVHPLVVGREINGLAAEARHDSRQRLAHPLVVEREINGLAAEVRHDSRQRLVRPLVVELHDWLRAERARMSKHNPVATAINAMFARKRPPGGLRPVPR